MAWLGFLVTDPDPAGDTVTLTGYPTKLAVTFLLEVIVTVTGFVLPVASPLQFWNAYPVAGLAVSVTCELGG